ncbi:flagellar assembly protein FliH [Moritella sp. F3]|uniref:flagellar assembly protein FliH n=1 Tax=Moritella sp. F3 TaxID=2718882 RepID=UPI0018E1766A|nr:flagellar assembly protein FliH [Moritella sp. F3]GIC78052.1 flagellar assembly protein FliH [Moritella sp. F1]GIC82547.1 flagellar assembly protein FliH [Moritella sp. F3]
MTESLKHNMPAFEGSDEHQIEDWYLPEFENTQAAALNTNALGMKHDWYEGKQSHESVEEIEPQPMTAEELDEIRQAAYDDGFAEGKEQGYQDGLASGTAEGLSQGETEGLAQGLAQGLAEGQHQILEKATAWEQLQTQMHTPLAAVNSEVESELIRVATGLAEELIKTEVTFNHDILLQTLKLALAALPVLEQKITITLHPDDLAVINEYYAAEECAKRGWVLISEPMMKQGDLVINNEVSSVELLMEQRIKQMMRQFLIANKPGA